MIRQVILYMLAHLGAPLWYEFKKPNGFQISCKLNLVHLHFFFYSVYSDTNFFIQYPVNL